MTKPNVLLVAVDTQFDFVMASGKLPVPGAERIVVPGISHLTALDPAVVAGVLFTFDTHSSRHYEGSPENLGDPQNGRPGFPIHCEKDTPGWQNVFNPALVPSAIPVWTLRKHVFDMWEESSDAVAITETPRGSDGRAYEAGSCGPAVWNRDLFFRSAQDGEVVAREMTDVDTVRIFGVASDFCVKYAIAGFLERGYRVEVVTDLTAGIQRDILKTVADEFPGRVAML